MNVEDQEALRRFNDEWDKLHSTTDNKPPIDPRDLHQGNSPKNLSESLNLSTMMNTTTTYNPPQIPTTGDRCNQCNLLHPPLPPGDKCPNAVTRPQVQPAPTQPLTEGNIKKPIIEQRPVNPPPVSQAPFVPAKEPHQTSVTYEAPVQPEPVPLADNNIPTEIHINKYLKSWGELIQTHCKNHSIENVKRLMRHLTVEITDFLEHNKGR